MQTNLIATDLQAKGRASFLILLQTVNELTEKQENVPPYFYARYRQVSDCVKRIPSGSFDGGEAQLRAYRDDVIAGIRELYMLNVYTTVVTDWVMHGGLLNIAASEAFPSLPEAEEVFQTLISAILDSGKGESELTAEKLQQSLAYIPLRMATVKYKSYVTDAFKRMAFNLMPEDADGFGCLFNPMTYLNGNEWLSEIKKPLDDIWATDCTAMNTETVNQNNNMLDGVRKETTNTLDFLCQLLDGLSAGLIALKHGEAYLNDETRKLTGEELNRAIDKEMEKIVYGPDAADLPDDAAFRETHALFYETGLDYFTLLGTENKRTSGDIDGFLKTFLPMLDTPGLPGNRRRFLRQRFMYYLQYPYPMDEFHKYFIDTYNSLDDANRLYMLAYVTTQLPSQEVDK